MRKIFSVILLAISMFIASQAASMNEAMAQDVWAYSEEGNYDYYIMTPVYHEENDNGFSCTVKIVHNGNFHSTYMVKFVYGKDLAVNYYILDRYRMTWNFIGNINNDPRNAAIYEKGCQY